MSEVGTASRRRRGPSVSDSEYSEQTESNNEAVITVKSDDDDDDDDDEESVEGDESSEYTDQSESEGGERDPADGESPTEERLDDDEDVKNPAFIPRKGAFYEHDSRGALGEGEGEKEETTEEERPRKNLWKQKEKWGHDCFDEGEQAPKSREELVRLYGYDIRSKDMPPDQPPTTYSESRGRGRGRGGRRRGKSSFGEYLPNSRSQRGQYRGSRQYSRNPRRGATGRQYNRPDDRPSLDVRSSDGSTPDVRSSDGGTPDVRSQDVKSSDVKSQDVRSQNLKSQDEPVLEQRPAEKPKPKMKSQDVRTELPDEQRQVTDWPASDGQPIAGQAEQQVAYQKSRTNKHGDRGGATSSKPTSNLNREEGRPKRYSAQRQNAGTAAPQKFAHTPPGPPPFIASAPAAMAGSVHQHMPNTLIAAVPRPGIPAAMSLTQTAPPIAGVAPMMPAASPYFQGQVIPAQPLPAQGMTALSAHGIPPPAMTAQVMAPPAPNLPPTQFSPQVAAITPQVAPAAPVVSEPGMHIGGAVYYPPLTEGTTYYPTPAPTVSTEPNIYSGTPQTSGTPPAAASYHSSSTAADSQGVVFYDTQGQQAGQSKPRVKNVIAIVKPEEIRTEGGAETADNQRIASSQSEPANSTNPQTDTTPVHLPSQTDNRQTRVAEANNTDSNELTTTQRVVSHTTPTPNDSIEQSNDPVTPVDRTVPPGEPITSPSASAQQNSPSSPQTSDVTQSVGPSIDSQSAAASPANTTSAVETAADTSAVKTAADTSAVEAAADTSAVETAADTSAVKTAADTSAVEAAADTSAVEIAADTSAVKTAAGTNAVETASAVETAAEAASAVETAAETASAVETAAETASAVETAAETANAVETAAETASAVKTAADTDSDSEDHFADAEEQLMGDGAHIDKQLPPVKEASKMPNGQGDTTPQERGDTEV